MQDQILDLVRSLHVRCELPRLACLRGDFQVDQFPSVIDIAILQFPKQVAAGLSKGLELLQHETQPSKHRQQRDS